MSKLTAKQQKFVSLYMEGKSQSDAYRGAYSCENMSDKSIWNLANKLSKHTEVAPLLSKYRAKRAERANYTSDHVLIHLSEILQSDVADIVDEETYAFKPLSEWPLIWRQMVEAVQVKDRHEGAGEDRIKIGEEISYKFMSKTKALELVGKHVDVGAYADKVKIEVVDRASVLEKARERAHIELPAPLH